MNFVIVNWECREVAQFLAEVKWAQCSLQLSAYLPLSLPTYRPNLG